MRCHQCDHPAIYNMSGVPLCLNCADRLQSIQDRQFLQNAAMLNHTMDAMDAAVGFSTGESRIPIHAIAQGIRKGAILNNISITNSSVGVVNTGDLARIDAAITMMKGSDVEEIGQLVQTLGQTIVNATDVDGAVKGEMLALLKAISDQVVRERQPTVLKSLLRSLEERAKGIVAISTVAGSLGAAIGKLFG